MEDKITARLVIEIMGRPPEHIEEGLNTLVVRMGSEKGMKILKKDYHKAKKIENTENLYTAFAEVEAEFENSEKLFAVIFNYMPANIEIIEPANFKLKNFELNTLANFILGKLHNYDEIAKRIIVERDILIKTLENATGKKITDFFPTVVNKEDKKKSKKRKRS